MKRERNTSPMIQIREFGKLINAKVLDKLQFRLCDCKSSGGVYKLKHDIIGTRGNIKSMLSC